MAWALAVAAPGAAQPPAAPASSVYRKTTATAAAGSAAEDQAAQAERIVTATLAAIGRAESISARVRERIRVGDRVIVGAGRYVQSGLGEDQRYRYETSLQCDTEAFELLEVCDGLFAWSFRRIGGQQPLLERLDIRRIRERLQQLQAAHDPTVSPYVGGIQKTLSLLRYWFRFVSVEQASIDELAVWQVEGRLHPDTLAPLFPDQREAIMRPGGISAHELPDGTPWAVRLSIGKRELFPFRIEWLAIPGRRPVAAGAPEPIAVLELFDVRIGEPVDAAAFVYKPATEGLIDMTEAVLGGVTPQRP